MRALYLTLIVACASDPSSGEDAGGEPAADSGAGAPDAAGAGDAAGAADAAQASCDAVFGEFVLDVLTPYSNVCVDRATCAFTRGAGPCAGSVTCDYQGAGVLTEAVTFEAVDGAWVASFQNG